ncbi:MAG: polyketide synthase dehydratase domain-containing protein [Candidatus Schekmanbacteria bacterium]|nr:polyketide synthase dehydratase domain-containing protein [Candidatus Schekmanbacteria bacterium]
MSDMLHVVNDLVAELSSAERELLCRALLGSPAPIAVVGMSCRFPGGANDPFAFWQRLLDGYDAVTEVPPTRWNIADYHDPDPAAPGKSCTRHAAFLDEIAGFDAQFFEISPHEAARMDPQQRILLEVSWEALEDAGIVPGTLKGSRTGVYVGACSHDYEEIQTLRGIVADAHTLTGGLASILAGRVSYVFGLEGPCLTVDTACSSSLVAVHLGVRALRARECDAALVAGTNAMLSPEGFVRLSRMRALSSDGRCRTFDGQANGYVRGEGVGVVVLKRLEDAVRDADRVWAVIRGTAINHDGRSAGLTAPNGLAQRAVINRALADGGIAAPEVGLIEAHGTATPLGDPIEMETLCEVFGAASKDAERCAVSSVKANIGHLEGAAGIAGLIKAILAVRFARIPPQINFQQLNPRIHLQGTRLEIATSPRAWEPPARSAPRVAGISSFGISGTNAHVVIADACHQESAPVPPAILDERPFVVPLSARTAAALADSSRALERALRDGRGPLAEASLADIAYTACVRRAHHAFRRAFATRSREHLVALLAAGSDTEPAELARGMTSAPRIAFHCSGSSPRRSHLDGLLASEAAFRATFERCEAALAEVWGGAVRLREAATSDPRVSWATEVALAALWRSWGVEPAVVTADGQGAAAARLVAGEASLAESARLVLAQDPPPCLPPQAGGGAAFDLPPQAGGGREGGRVAGVPAGMTAIALAAGAPAAEPRGHEVVLHLLPSATTSPAYEPVSCPFVDPLASPDVDAPTALRRALGHLYELGANPRWSALFAEGAARVVSLPPYPWQREPLWIDLSQTVVPAVRSATPHRPLLAELIPVADCEGLSVAHGEVSLHAQPFLADHRVGTEVVFPAAAFVEALLSVGKHLDPPATTVAKLTIDQPLVLSPSSPASVQVAVRRDPAAGSGCTARFHARATLSAGWMRHATATLSGPEPGVSARPAELDEVRRRCRTAVPVDAHYELLQAHGIALGPAFHAVTELAAGRHEALAYVQLPAGLPPDPFVVHPALLDACFQTAAAALSGGAPARMLIAGVDRFVLHRPAWTAAWCHATISEPSPEAIEVELSVMDDAGNLLAEAHGLHIRRIPLGARPGTTLPAHSLASITATIEAVLRDLLGFQEGFAIPREQYLDALGLDSLLAVDLAASLGAAFGVELPNTLALENPTVAAIAGRVAEELKISP